MYTSENKLTILDKSDDDLRWGLASLQNELPLGRGDIREFDWYNQLSLKRFESGNAPVNIDHDDSALSLVGKVDRYKLQKNGFEVGINFDIADDIANRIAGKWDRGYIKGLSTQYYTETPGKYEWFAGSWEKALDSDDFRIKEVLTNGVLTGVAVVSIPRDMYTLQRNSLLPSYDELDQIRNQMKKQAMNSYSAEDKVYQLFKDW